MVKKKKLTVKFILKGNDEKKRVYCKILFDRKAAEIALDYWFSEKEWDNKLQLPKNDSGAENEILKIKTRIQDIRTELSSERKSITSKRLKLIAIGEEVTLTQSKHIKLLDAINLFIEFKESSKVSDGTKESYRVKVNRWKEFITENSRKDLLLSEVDKSFIFEFDFYLSNRNSAQYKKPLTRNYINKIHDSFIVFINWCILKRYLLRNPYNDYKLPKVDDSDIIKYLTEEELKGIHKLNLSYNKTLNTCKEIFLFSCYTGLRIGESKSLKVSDIKSKNGEYSIENFRQQKTGKKKDIPLFKYAKDIFNQYRNSEEAKITGFLFPKRIYTKINVNLKHIDSLCGINKGLHFHMARHTCGTMLISNGMELEKCAEFLGHTNTNTTKIYAKITKASLIESVKKVDENIRRKFGNL